MSKTHNYSVITLAACSAFVDFLIMTSEISVFPRDRILHLAIAYFAAITLSYILSELNFDGTIIKAASLFLVTFRFFWIIYKFTQYFHIFHGSNTLGIIFFSVVVVLIIWNFERSKTQQLYIFFSIFNMAMLVMIFILSMNNLNIVNLYSNSQSFEFSFSKLFVFFDIITISLLTEKGEERLYCQKRYLKFSAAIFALLTFLQGLCVKGTILYSLSPLQSLMQIFSTDTIKRFDYILTLFQTLNYFGAVILYTMAIKKVFNKEKYVEKT